MTRYSNEELTCYVCGKTNSQRVLMSTYTNGYIELDTRPAPAARYADLDRIQVCPHCGYCALVLASGPVVAKHVVTSREYMAQLADFALPRLVNQWLSLALIKEAAREYSDAAWCCLYAAWVCDDEGKERESAALQCRRKAIAFFVRAQGAAASPPEAPDIVRREDLILIDLLRRCGMFSQASELCKKALAAAPSDPSDRLLEFELKLITQQDTMPLHRRGAGDSGTEGGTVADRAPSSEQADQGRYL